MRLKQQWLPPEGYERKALATAVFYCLLRIELKEIHVGCIKTADSNQDEEDRSMSA
jgi:hypothetical protein